MLSSDFLNILYEDNHIIVVLKPENVLSQGDNSGEASLFDYVKDYIKIKYEKKSNVFLGLVHRLDRPVGGVIVFAKTSKAASRLSEFIRDGKFEKIYFAVVNGIIEEKKGKLENYLIKQTNKMGNIAKVVFDNKNNDAKLAVLNYEVICENVQKNLSLLKVNLKTGRFHQIRVQLAYMGNAIYGDRKYGDYIKYNRDNVPLALFAKVLSFPHPVKDEIIRCEAALPNKEPFTIF